VGAWKAKLGDSLPVDMLEVVDDKVVNGFRIAINSAQPAQALRELLMFNAAVFQRLQSQFKVVAAADVVTASRKLLRARTLTLTTYQKFANSVGNAVTESVKRYLAATGNDQGLNIAASLDAFMSAASGRNGGKAFAAHVTLVNQLDVAMTLVRVNRKR